MIKTLIAVAAQAALCAATSIKLEDNSFTLTIFADKDCAGITTSVTGGDSPDALALDDLELLGYADNTAVSVKVPSCWYMVYYDDDEWNYELEGVVGNDDSCVNLSNPNELSSIIMWNKGC
mgnify:CR=1 FL=1